MGTSGACSVCGGAIFANGEVIGYGGPICRCRRTETVPVFNYAENGGEYAWQKDVRESTIAIRRLTEVLEKLLKKKDGVTK